MLNERKLTERELESRESILRGLLSNKRNLVKKYGKDAEKVMYGIATKKAKSKVEDMNKDKLKELIQLALEGVDSSPKSNTDDINIDKSYSSGADYGSEVSANTAEDNTEVGELSESLNPEVTKAVSRFIKAMAKRYSYSEKDAVFAIQAALKQRNFDGLDERVAKIDEILDEMDMNDPVLMRMRASKPEPSRGGIDYDEALDLRLMLSQLEDSRDRLFRDMEQEAEPEGGPIADRYGDELNKIEDRIYKIRRQLNDYDMNEATRQDLGMVSSISKSRAKSHLKNPSDDGSKVYGLDSDGKRVELKGLNDVDKFKKFEIDADLKEGASKEDQLKVAKAAFDKAEKDGDIRKQELALAAIDLINGNIKEELSPEDHLQIVRSMLVKAEKDGDDDLKRRALADMETVKKIYNLKEAMDDGQVFDYFANKGYVVKERRPDGYPKKEGVIGYQVTDRPDSGRRSDNPQTVIFQYNPSTDQFTISQMNGYKIDQKDAIKAGMRQQSQSWVAGIDSYITDGNYNPVNISAEGLIDIVDHVMGGLSREAKAQADFYRDRGSTSGTIDEKISTLVKEKLTKSSSVEDHVEDFKDSDAPQFKGKSLKKIKQMALASFLSKQGKKKVAEGFKVGQKVTYLGHPAEITKVDKDVMDRVYYNVSYDKGTGKTKVTNIFNKGGEIKALKEIGMFHDPIGYRKSKSEPEVFDKKYVAKDTYDILKHGKKLMTFFGSEGEANAYINKRNRELEENND